MRIHNVQRARHSPAHHPRDLQGEKEIRPHPPIPRRIRARHPEPIQPRAPQHHLRHHEHHPELGLVNPVVQPREHPRGPVRDQPAESEAHEGADEGPCVHVAGFFFAEPEGGPEHDGGEHDADHDGPAYERALDEAGPENAGVEEEGEGPEEEREVAGGGVAAVERAEGVEVGVLLRGRQRRRIPLRRWGFFALALDALLPPYQVPHRVDFEPLLPYVRRLRAPKHQQRHHPPRENRHKPKRPLVPHLARHLPHHHRRRERPPEQRQVTQRHPHPPLMHTIHIAHTRIHQSLERREPHSLEDPRPEERLIRAPAGASPRAGYHDDEGAEQVDVALSPDAGRGDEEEAGEGHAQEVVPCEERHGGEGAVEVDGEGDGVGGEEGGEGGGDDGGEAEDEGDEVAVPEGPVLEGGREIVSIISLGMYVWGGCGEWRRWNKACTHQRVIRVVRRLRHQQYLPTPVIFQPPISRLLLSPSLILQHIRGPCVASV